MDRSFEILQELAKLIEAKGLRAKVVKIDTKGFFFLKCHEEGDVFILRLGRDAHKELDIGYVMPLSVLSITINSQGYFTRCQYSMHLSNPNITNSLISLYTSCIAEDACTNCVYKNPYPAATGCLPSSSLGWVLHTT